MSQEPPQYEDAVKTYVDKPNPLTLLSGGLFIAVGAYFVSGWFFSAIGLDNILFQFILPVLIILASIQMSNSVNVKITMNTKTGYIEARGGGYKYSGYANEPDRFMVLQKQTVGRNNQTFTDYKLSLKVDEETSFEIPLEVGQVREIIKNVEKTKEAVPVSK